MKGHTLPGIKQRPSAKTAEGRAGSSAFQKKVKFYEDTRSKDYIGDYVKDRTKTEATPQSTTTRDMSVDAQQDNVRRFISTGDLKPNTITETETQKEADYRKVKSDDNLTLSKKNRKPTVRNTKVRVKLKGKKNKSTIADPSNPGASVTDVKKIKMSRGYGKGKQTVKVKYDKQGNVKKESIRYGRFGLSKKRRPGGGSSVTVGTKGGEDLRGAAAAQAIIKKQGSNIRGKRKSGDKKA